MILRESVVMYDQGNGQFTRVEYADSHCLIWICTFEILLSDVGAHKFGPAINLENRCLQIFLDNDIFGSELPSLRAENSNDTFEATNDNLINWWVSIVYVSNTDRLIMELFAGANCSGPPFFELEN